MTAIAHLVGADVVGEHHGRHAVVVRTDDVVRRPVQHQGADVRVLGDHRPGGLLGLVEGGLVAAPGRADLGIAERLGVEGDRGVVEGAGVGPEARRVERRDVAAPLLGRGELRRERVGIGGLAQEVVVRPVRPRHQALHLPLHVRQRRVEDHQALGAFGEAGGEVLDHRAAEVTADEHRPLVAEVLEERGQVQRVGDGVTEAVGADLGLAERPQVRADDLEPGGRQRRDDPPVEALGLGPAVHEQDRHAADAFVDVGLAEPPPVEPVRDEPRRIEVRRTRVAGGGVGRPGNDMGRTLPVGLCPTGSAPTAAAPARARRPADPPGRAARACR